MAAARGTVANMSNRGVIAGFEAKKAAQMARWFVGKAGGKMEKLKLAKLFYLAEREYIIRHDEPMLYDELYSLEHGPICSSVLDGINGRPGLGRDWQTFARLGKDLAYVGSSARDELDHLSDADMRVIEHVWDKFGWMTASQLKEYAQENCPEYQAVAAGIRAPIPYSDLYEAIGHPDPLAASDEVTRHRRRSAFFIA